MECVNIGWNETEGRKHAVQCAQKKMVAISLQQKRNKVKKKMAKSVPKSIFERTAQIMKNSVQKPPPKVERKNPPVVIFTNGLGIKVCKGCPRRITKEHQVYLNNMVFHQQGQEDLLIQKPKNIA